MKEEDADSKCFPVSEIFRSIQGEGVCQGQPTTFIRFTGCNLRCEWCDTRYAYEGGKRMPLGEIMKQVAQHGSRAVCLTGGEPLLQPRLLELAASLLRSGHIVHLETTGSLPVRDFLETVGAAEPVEEWRRNIVLSVDVKPPSSGECGSFLEDNLFPLGIRDQLKFVVKDKKDIRFAEDFLSHRTIRAVVIIQPAGGSDLSGMVRRFLSAGWPENADVRFVLQAHKVIWGASKRGV